MKSKMRCRWLGSFLWIWVAACGTESPPLAASGGDGLDRAAGKADQPLPAPALQKALAKALALLQKKAQGSDSLGARLSGETHRRIRDGEVSVLSLQALTADDYQRVRREFQQSHPDEYDFPADHAAFSQGSAETRYVLSHYDGWMWSERIYVNVASPSSLAPESLASTLVHETNHVLNRSEENYYLPAAPAQRDCAITDVAAHLVVDPARALREEYRAFYVEYLFSDGFAREINAKVGQGGATRLAESGIRAALCAHVRDLYGIEPRVRLRAEVSEDRLLPTRENWQATRASTAHRDPLYSCE